jgi:drug/metabolite transporter (DMT)-like permease
VTPRAWAPAFVAVCAIFGCAFLLIKLSGETFSPLGLTFLRVSIAALTLRLLLTVVGDRLPREPRVWGHLAVAGLLMNALPFSLFALGEQYVPSALAGIYNGTTPLFTVLFAGAILAHRPGPRDVVSVSVGFAGVLVIAGVWRLDASSALDGGLGGQLGGQLMCLAAGCSYGIGIPYIRRFVSGRPESVVSLTCAQLTLASGWLVAALAVSGQWRVTRPVTLQSTVAVIVLGCVGTAGGITLHNLLTRRAGPTISAGVTYVVPVVATVLGVTALDERLSWNEPAGTCLVLLGVWMSGRSARSARGGDHTVSPPAPAARG